MALYQSFNHQKEHGKTLFIRPSWGHIIIVISSPWYHHGIILKLSWHDGSEHKYISSGHTQGCRNLKGSSTECSFFNDGPTLDGLLRNCILEIFLTNIQFWLLKRNGLAQLVLVGGNESKQTTAINGFSSQDGKECLRVVGHMPRHILEAIWIQKSVVVFASEGFSASIYRMARIFEKHQSIVETQDINCIFPVDMHRSFFLSSIATTDTITTSTQTQAGRTIKKITLYKNAQAFASSTIDL